MLFDSSIGVVVVDRNYDIQSINPARQLLGIHGQGISEDLIHLASGISAGELKASLDDALRGATSDAREVGSTDPASDRIQIVRIVCHGEKVRQTIRQ